MALITTNGVNRWDQQGIVSVARCKCSNFLLRQLLPKTYRSNDRKGESKSDPDGRRKKFGCLFLLWCFWAGQAGKSPESVGECKLTTKVTRLETSGRRCLKIANCMSNIRNNTFGAISETCHESWRLMKGCVLCTTASDARQHVGHRGNGTRSKQSSENLRVIKNNDDLPAVCCPWSASLIIHR